MKNLFFENMKSSRYTLGNIDFYFASVMLFIGLSTGLGGGIAAVPIQFFLKDHLKFNPSQIALFGGVTSIPLCFGLLLGMIRDRWQPRPWGDRIYFAIMPLLLSGCYLWLASGLVSYTRLLITLLFATAFGFMLNTAAQGLMTLVGQRTALTGRLSSVFWITATIPSVLNAWMGGWLTNHITLGTIFLINACLSISVSML